MVPSSKGTSPIPELHIETEKLTEKIDLFTDHQGRGCRSIFAV
jgi:hypothetical protein